jgi:hypothetical protein
VPSPSRGARLRADTVCLGDRANREGYVRICGRSTACIPVAGAVAVALAGCGGGGHSMVKAPQRPTIAQACKQHKEARVAVVGGLVDYTTYMRSEDPAFRLTFAKSGVAGKVALAIKTLEKASGLAARTSAGKRFFSDLDRLERSLKTPPAVPSAVIGDQNASKIERAARAVGCSL